MIYVVVVRLRVLFVFADALLCIYFLPQPHIYFASHLASTCSCPRHTPVSVCEGRSAFHYVFYAGHQPTTIFPSELLQVCSNTSLGARRCADEGGAIAPTPGYVAAIITQTGGAWPPALSPLQIVTETEPLELAPPAPAVHTPGVTNFQYAVLAPAHWPFVVLGELDKVVPLSRVRFGELKLTKSSLTWEVRGGVGEKVSIYWSRMMVYSVVVCEMSPQGQATLVCGGAQALSECTCEPK